MPFSSDYLAVYKRKRKLAGSKGKINKIRSCASKLAITPHLRTRPVPSSSSTFKEFINVFGNPWQSFGNSRELPLSSNSASERRADSRYFPRNHTLHSSLPRPVLLHRRHFVLLFPLGARRDEWRSERTITSIENSKIVFPPFTSLQKFTLIKYSSIQIKTETRGKKDVKGDRKDDNIG